MTEAMWALVALAIVSSRVGAAWLIRFRPIWPSRWNRRATVALDGLSGLLLVVAIVLLASAASDRTGVLWLGGASLAIATSTALLVVAFLAHEHLNARATASPRTADAILAGSALLILAASLRGSASGSALLATYSVTAAALAVTRASDGPKSPARQHVVVAAMLATLAAITLALLADSTASREPATARVLLALVILLGGLLAGMAPFNLWILSTAEYVPSPQLAVLSALGSLSFAVVLVSTAEFMPWILSAPGAGQLMLVVGIVALALAALAALGESSPPAIVLNFAGFAPAIGWLAFSTTSPDALMAFLLLLLGRAFSAPAALLALDALDRGRMRPTAAVIPAALALLVASADLAGLPPTSGAIARWIVLEGAPASATYAAAVAAAAALALLAARRFGALLLVRRLRGAGAAALDASPPPSWRRTAIPTVLSGVTLLVGVFPAPLVTWFREALAALSGV